MLSLTLLLPTINTLCHLYHVRIETDRKRKLMDSTLCSVFVWCLLTVQHSLCVLFYYLLLFIYVAMHCNVAVLLPKRPLFGETMFFINTHIYFCYHSSLAINYYLIKKPLFNWRICTVNPATFTLVEFHEQQFKKES